MGRGIVAWGWVALVLVLAGYSGAAPAQQTAREVLTDVLLSKGMVREDIDQLMAFRGRQLDLGWDMSLDQAFAVPLVVLDEESTGLALAVIRNAGPIATCVRIKGDMRGEGVFDKAVATENLLVGPGAAVAVVGSGMRITSGEWDVHMDAAVAVWQAPPAASSDAQCQESAPVQLNSWLAAPGYEHFADFVKRRASGASAQPAE